MYKGPKSVRATIFCPDGGTYLSLSTWVAWFHLFFLPRRLVCQKPNVEGDQTDKYLVSACATIPPLQVTSDFFMELRKYPRWELTLTTQSKLWEISDASWVAQWQMQTVIRDAISSDSCFISKAGKKLFITTWDVLFSTGVLCFVLSYSYFPQERVSL